MKRIFILVIAMAFIVSFTGCGLIGGGIKLEEGQVQYTFTKDGELTMNGIIDNDDFEDDMDIDLKDDEKDIISDIEDYFDDMDIDSEVTKVKVGKDFVTIEIVFEDFETMFVDFQLTLEDYAELSAADIEEFGEYYKFVTFEKGEDIDVKDLDDYEDAFVITIDGGEEGSYYEFPYDLLAVSEDMDYERINDTTIYVEDGEVGLVFIDGEIDGEPFDYSAYEEDIYEEDINEVDEQEADEQETDELEADGNNEENQEWDTPGVEYEANNEHMGSVVFNADGSAIKIDYIGLEDFEWQFGMEEDATALSFSEIELFITEYYDYYYENVTIQSIEEQEEGVILTLTTEMPDYLFYPYGTTLNDEMFYFDDIESFLEGNKMVNYTDGTDATLDVVTGYLEDNVLYIEGGDYGRTYQFPGKILLVDDSMTWERIDDYTIFVSYWGYGLVVYE